MLVNVCMLKPADHIEREDRSIAFIGTGSGNDIGFLFVPNTVGEGYHCPRSWGLAGQGFWEQRNCRTQSHNKQIFHIRKGLQTYRLPPSFQTLGNCGSERKMSLSLSCTQPMATLGLRSRSLSSTTSVSRTVLRAQHPPTSSSHCPACYVWKSTVAAKESTYISE